MDTRAIRILVADDNAAGRELMRTLLQMEDYVVYEARDGNEAVEMARRLRPDVVLMDVHMPVIDGIESTRLRREDRRSRSIPVIAPTATSPPGERRRAVRAGRFGCAPKPVGLV